MAFTELITHPMALPVSLPLLAGLLCLLLPNAANTLRAWLAVLTAGTVLVLVWPLFQQAGTTWEPLAWLSLRVDPLSGVMLLAIAFFGFLVALYSVGYMKGRDRHRAYFTYLLWTLGVACLAVLAENLITLLVCWGFLGLLLYLMVGLAGPGAAAAARKSMMIIGASDALLLLGIAIYWQLAGSTVLSEAGPRLVLDGPAAYCAFLCFLAGALAKAGAVPFHSWVPDCGEKADAPVSAFLPASLDKLLGVYLLARCLFDLFVPTPAMQFLLMLIGAVTILSMSLGALAQNDLKRLLSYTAVAQVGYIILGLASGTLIGLVGGLFHMLNHAIYKSALFLCAGVVEKETGETHLDRLGGLAKLMPVTFGVCLVAALAGAGIPPLSGFASKWMVYQGIIESASAGGMSWVVWLAVAMLGSALTLAAFVKVLHATFLCKASPAIAERDGIRDAGFSMALPMLMLAVLCVVFGVWAFQVPLGLMVFPVVGVDAGLVDGSAWWAGLATSLIIGSIIIGLIGYGLSMRAGKLRRVSTYIGGEQMQDVYISGDEEVHGRHVEVTGINFYTTIERLPVLGRLLGLAQTRVFDVYYLCQRGTNYLVVMLRSLHTGILPAYLRWFVAGILVVVWVVTRPSG